MKYKGKQSYSTVTIWSYYDNYSCLTTELMYIYASMSMFISILSWRTTNEICLSALRIGKLAYYTPITSSFKCDLIKIYNLSDEV